MLLLPMIDVKAQDLPVVCGGDLVRYGVRGQNGTSVFEWVIEGGTIVENYNDSVDIRWDYTNGIQSLTVTETTAYGCIGDPFVANLFVSNPNVDLGLDQMVCFGDSIEIIATISNAEFFTWDNSNESELTRYVKIEGQYWIEARDTNLCVVSDTMYLTVHDLPIVDFGFDSVEVCGADEIVELDAGTDGYIYRWSDPQYNNMQEITLANIIEDMEVWVQVEDVNSCIGMDTVFVDVCSDNLNIPNAFSPNDDTFNDLWQIEELYFYPDVSIVVFDRWGNKVFYGKGDEAHNWDGRDLKGNELPMDSYYYVIDLGNGAIPITGTVTILR